MVGGVAGAGAVMRERRTKEEKKRAAGFLRAGPSCSFFFVLFFVSLVLGVGGEGRIKQGRVSAFLDLSPTLQSTAAFSPGGILKGNNVYMVYNDM